MTLPEAAKKAKNIGLSTYAFTWRMSSRMSTPLSLEQMLIETAELGGSVFQICDYPKIEHLTATELGDLASQARDLGMTLEVGTRGLGFDKLNRYLDIAGALDAPLLRSMFNDAQSHPDASEVPRLLRRIAPRLERQAVSLALETYEQIPVETLVATVEAANHPRIGICLDPANCVAALDMPESVIERTAAHVNNLHVKDFRFTRADGWVGFRLSGCPLGEGLLRLDAMLQRITPAVRGINLIVEHWLDWQGSAQRTAAMEAAWTRHSMEVLKSTDCG